MARRRKPGRGMRGGKTLVRGADGALYLLTENKAPVKLKEKEAKIVTQILEDVEDQLARSVKEAVPSLGSGVHMIIPEVFM
jgi:hypothetical protein